MNSKLNVPAVDTSLRPTQVTFWCPVACHYGLDRVTMPQKDNSHLQVAVFLLQPPFFGVHPFEKTLSGEKYKRWTMRHNGTLGSRLGQVCFEYWVSCLGSHYWCLDTKLPGWMDGFPR